MPSITHLFPSGFIAPAATHEQPGDPYLEFRNALQAAGLVPPQSFRVGQLDRVDLEDEPRGRRSGWYVLYDDGIVAGAFGSWKDGSKHSWSSRSTESLTPEEQAHHRRLMELAQEAREDERRIRQAQAQATARERIQNSSPAPHDHPYLIRKQISPSGARVNADGDLLIPAIDTAGEIHTYQRITPDGTKRFLFGGEIRGHFATIGEPGPTILLCEGFATGVSLHEATGLPVCVAFSAVNLGPVAEAIRPACPTARILICADADPSGVGVNKAREAAERIGGMVVTPTFTATRLEPYTDFNDLHQAEGLDAVTRQIEIVLNHRRIPSTSIAAARDSIEPQKWIIKGLIEAGGVSMTFGTHSVGKSFFEIDRACCIAHGREYWGHKVSRPGLVYYLAGEGINGVRRRFLAWHQYHGVAIEDDTPLVLSDRAVDLLNDGDLSALQATLDVLVERHGPLRYLVIDTMWQNAGAEDENSSAEARKLIQRVRAGIQERYEAAVTFVHHTGRAGTGPDGTPRGSSAMDGAMDSMFILYLAPNDPSQAITSMIRKLKDGQITGDSTKRLQLVSVELEGMQDEDGDPVTSAVLIEAQDAPVPVWQRLWTETQREVFNALADRCNALRIQNLPYALPRAEFARSMGGQGMPRNTCLRAIEFLVEQSVIEQSGPGNAVNIAIAYDHISLLEQGSPREWDE